jgi:sulfite reductase (ferredoxin)
MNILNKPVFPCAVLPEDPSECKLLGLYPQRQEGLWLQRIKLPGGVITSGHWKCLADICEKYLGSTPIRLTTRQDIELHNVPGDKVPMIQAEFHASGITCVGAAGDTLRNITICPGSGLCQGSHDLQRLAVAVSILLESYPQIYSLPRKFKISFSSCKNACAQPWINDLSFVTKIKDGETVFDVIGAGSLGARPATGIVLKKDLPLSDVLLVSLAAVRLFNGHGDREKRTKARLRHVRERVGDDVFIEMLDAEITKCKNEKFPLIADIVRHDKEFSRVAELDFAFGDITPVQAREIAQLTQDEGVKVRLQNHHKISVFARDAEKALKFIKSSSVLNYLLGGPDIVSCPGTHYCKFALSDTNRAEKDLREVLKDEDVGSVRISGCPNGCAHTGVAHIGISGRIQKNDSGENIEGFQILKGGGMGKTAALAKKHISFVPSSEIKSLLDKL